MTFEISSYSFEWFTPPTTHTDQNHLLNTHGWHLDGILRMCFALGQFVVVLNKFVFH